MVECRDCGKQFERPIQRGRPAVRCPECRANPKPSIADKSIELEQMVDDNSPVSIVPTSVRATPFKRTEVKEDDTIYQFRLMVGNLGLAYVGDSNKEAVAAFEHYAKASAMGFGQVGFETVQLWKLNQIENQYKLEKEFSLKDIRD